MSARRVVECPVCGRATAVTARETLARHNAKSTRTPCNGSGADVSERIAQQNAEDYDDWLSWLAK